MNPDDIEEGDDVYFECKVRANPDAYKVVWKHNVSEIIERDFLYREFVHFVYMYIYVIYMFIIFNQQNMINIHICHYCYIKKNGLIDKIN